MPRGGARPTSGGKRPGARRKRSKPTMQVELTEQATRDLLYFIEDLNLAPQLAPQIVSEVLIAAFTQGVPDDLDRWRDRFGNGQ